GDSGGGDGDAGVTDAGATDAGDAGDPLAGCVAVQLAGMEELDALVPNCTERVDELFTCQATLPQEDYVCTEGQAATAAEACLDEWAAFAEAADDANCTGG